MVSVYTKLQIANILVVVVPRDTCKRYVLKNDTTRKRTMIPVTNGIKITTELSI